MPLVPVVLGVLVALGALVAPVALGELVVWASAPMGDAAKPNAAANPRRGRIFRRAPIFDSTPEVIFNLLDFSSLVILVRHLFTTLIRPEQATGEGFLAFTELRPIIPPPDLPHHRSRSSFSPRLRCPQVAFPAHMYLSPFWFA
jgi:hypothetical protein